jgi:Fe2+ transport system protein FeoA
MYSMVIEEKYSRYWVHITSVLLVGALLFFIGYTSIEDILWKGILRLIAFGFLAGSVFSGLKVMQGKHTVEVDIEDDNLILTYRKKGRDVSRDTFALDSIGNLYYESHNGFWGRAFFKDCNIKFVPTDSDRPLTLVEVHGKALALSQENARKLMTFISDHAPNAKISNSSDD